MFLPGCFAVQYAACLGFFVVLCAVCAYFAQAQTKNSTQRQFLIVKKNLLDHKVEIGKSQSRFSFEEN